MTTTNTAPRALPRWLVPAVVATLLAMVMVRPLAILMASGPGPLSDFDMFHASAGAILSGEAARLYDESWYRALQERLFGLDTGGIWTYPPPYDLVVAPLGLLPRPLAMLLFTGLTLIAYLLVLRRLAGARLGLVLLLLLPMLMTSIIVGQNGLLTGSLVGLTAIALTEGRRWAGVPLGLMVIKPHLAAGPALHVLLARDTRTVAVAALTVALAVAAATLAFGAAIWPAFAAGVAHTSGRLSGDGYPLHRMVSLYAAARSLGAAPALATALQAAMALMAVTVIIAAQRRLARRDALGLACLAGLMISPYAYDYDLPVAAVGLVLILPVLAKAGRPAELMLLYGLFQLAAVWGNGIARTGYPALGGLAVPVILALTCRILWRGRAEATAAPSGDQ